MRTNWVIGVGAVLLLTACGSGGASGGSSTAQVPNFGAKAKVPAQTYDAEVILCTGGKSITTHCTGRTTGAQLAATAKKLSQDPGISAVHYLSSGDAEKAERQALSPSERSQFPPDGNSRPVFLVTLAGEGSQNDDFVPTYSALAGVDEAMRCVEDDICRVSTLRDAGVLG